MFPSRLPGARTLVVIGVCALVLGGFFTFLNYRAAEPDQAPVASDRSAEPVPTKRVVSKPGGFSVAVPTALSASKEGRTVQLSSRQGSLAVNVGPGERGKLRVAHKAFLRTLRAQYRKVDLMATERTKVDGRPAISAAGLATNAEKVRIRFVVVTVRGRPTNYTIAAFAARDSDPAETLPLVNAVVNGFKVRG